ncbi:hypothetical protein RQP46_004864 [Phenoliferia psychrophenolica]
MCSNSPLGQVLARDGAGFDSRLVFKTDAYGGSVYTSTLLPSGTTIVSCPFSQAVTPTLARAALAAVASELDSWTDHELLTTYLALHKVESGTGLEHLHQAYVESLPTEADLSTPSYWSDAELSLLEGTNLAPAVVERTMGWRKEFEGVKRKVGGEVAAQLSWNLYLWASTIISSRAFPSSLLHDFEPSPTPTPVLLPGVDTLNHSPHGVKVSWLSDVIKRTVSIVIEEDVAADQQVFNTYGAKSNEELLLGYGFVLPSNRSDTVALKLSIPPTPAPLSSTLASFSPPLTSLRHLVPRSGRLPEELLAQMRLFLATPEERDGLGQGTWEEVLGMGKVGWENEMDVLSALEGMLEAKLAGVVRSPVESGEGDVRDSVRAMVDEYRRGQVDILKAALADQQRRVDETIEKAALEGVDLGFGDEEDEDVEDEE